MDPLNTPSQLIAILSRKDSPQEDLTASLHTETLSTLCEQMENCLQYLMKLENRVDAICMLLGRPSSKDGRYIRDLKKRITSMSVNLSEMSEPGTPISERINPKNLCRLV